MTVIKIRNIINGLWKKRFKLSEGDHPILIFYLVEENHSDQSESWGKKENRDPLIALMASECD